MDCRLLLERIREIDWIDAGLEGCKDMDEDDKLAYLKGCSDTLDLLVRTFKSVEEDG